MLWTLIEATDPDHYRTAVQLFKEYAASLDFGLDFQHFEDELDMLPTMYGPPTGSLFLAELEGSYVGCAGLRQIENEQTCEIKRMYVRPTYRGLGIGKGLLSRSLDAARHMQYKTVKLDTIGYKMPHAVSLYKAFGFRETTPYNYNPYEGVLYFEKQL